MSIKKTFKKQGINIITLGSNLNIYSIRSTLGVWCEKGFPENLQLCYLQIAAFVQELSRNKSFLHAFYTVES